MSSLYNSISVSCHEAASYTPEKNGCDNYERNLGLNLSNIVLDAINNFSNKTIAASGKSSAIF